MNKIFIRPAIDLKIRDPLSGSHIPEAGLEVEESSYWTRRILDGDVVVGRQVSEQPKGKK